jgi:hypothetical protein
MGFVKPVADINIVSSSVELMVKSLTHNDVIVFSGGTKDIGKNNCKEGLRNILNLIKTISNTNIVLLTVPHRYDLESWACVLYCIYFKFQADPYAGKRNQSHTTGYRKCHGSAQNVPITKEQVSTTSYRLSYCINFIVM